jgi:dienelactone hydrolase
LPDIDKRRICLLGYSLGGMVALYSAALDERVGSVACFSGFTPLRTDTAAKPTGGLRRFSQWYGLLPKLGLYEGRESEIPYDYDDLLRLTAPRSCLIVSQKQDRWADFADVEACVQRASKAWDSQRHTGTLTHRAPDDISRFQEAQQDMFLDWLTGQKKN